MNRATRRRFLDHDWEAFELFPVTQPVTEDLVEAVALRAAEAARRFPSTPCPGVVQLTAGGNLLWLHDLQFTE